jgi:hypothetical protein
LESLSVLAGGAKPLLGSESQLLADQRSIDSLTWPRECRELLSTALDKRQQRLEPWILTAALDRSDGRLSHVRPLRQGSLRQTGSSPGPPEESGCCRSLVSLDHGNIIAQITTSLSRVFFCWVTSRDDASFPPADEHRGTSRR